MEVEVNASGFIIHSKGSIPEIIDWLSFRFDFRFITLPDTINLLYYEIKKLYSQLFIPTISILFGF